MGFRIAACVLGVTLAQALAKNLARQIFLAILLLLPCLDLLALFGLNSDSCRAFRAGGIKFGFLGAFPKNLPPRQA